MKKPEQSRILIFADTKRTGKQGFKENGRLADF
jgi:hypothetical protein